MATAARAAVGPTVRRSTARRSARLTTFMSAYSTSTPSTPPTALAGPMKRAPVVGMNAAGVGPPSAITLKSRGTGNAKVEVAVLVDAHAREVVLRLIPVEVTCLIALHGERQIQGGDDEEHHADEHPLTAARC